MLGSDVECLWLGFDSLWKVKAVANAAKTNNTEAVEAVDPQDDLYDAKPKPPY